MPAYPHKKQKTIIYEQAPSGYINIEKWEPPFLPVEAGYGFMGVLAEDSKTGELQCHCCGKWYELLSSHVFATHKMKAGEYQQKYGLLMSTALKSKRIRLMQSALMVELQKKGSMNVGNKKNRNGKRYGFTKKNEQAANRKGNKKALESQNKYGVCDLQITNKIIFLSKELGKTPSLVDIKKKYGGGLISIMHSRYGSYVKYCRNHLKMDPLFSRHNPRTKKDGQKYLLEIGRKSIETGNPVVLKKLLSVCEQKNVYKYFGSFPKYKKQLLEKVN